MRVLAIDPGPIKSHFARLSDVHGSESPLKIECGTFENEDINKYPWQFPQVDIIAFEKVESYGMAVGADVFETVFWTGRFYDKADRFCIAKLLRVGRREVKLHVCENAAAKDTNIRHALIDRFGLPGTKKKPGLTYGIVKDQWQALALAVTVYDKAIADERRQQRNCISAQNSVLAVAGSSVVRSEAV